MSGTCVAVQSTLKNTLGRERVHGREITYLIVIGSAVVHFAQVIRVLYNFRQLESRYHCTFTHCHISHHHLDSA